MNLNHSLPSAARLTEILRDALAGTATPGVSASLLIDSQPVFTSGVGFQDLQKTTPIDSQAKFYIYSATKSYIAAVILRLAESGQLGLDMPVQRYLPELAVSIPVTLRQLLNHSGGIPDYGGMREYYQAVRENPRDAWTSEQFLAATLPRGLNFAPGEGWAYSNIGYLLLRQVIETVTGSPLSTALHDHIIVPLGVQDTHTAQTLQDASQLTPGFSAFFTGDASLQDIRSFYHPVWVSHGVVVATASDLARVFDAIYSGELIQPQSRTAMLEAVDVPVEHPLFKKPGYGLGVMIDQESPWGVMAGHGGGGPGYAAGVIHLTNVDGRRVTSAALANSDQDDLGLKIAFQLAAAVGEMGDLG